MLVQTAAPAQEPVTPSDLYLRSRIDPADDGGMLEGSMIQLLIAAARRHAEAYTNRSFITQSWKLVIDCFPSGDDGYFGMIQLDNGLVQSIDSIGYLAMDGTQQTLPAQNYIADLSGCPARITPVFGRIWPITMPQIASVWVNYTAGYGNNPTDVPEGIRDWIAMRVGSIYQNREEVIRLQRGEKMEKLPYVDSLLDPYQVVIA